MFLLKRSLRGSFFRIIGGVFWSIFALFPIYWMVIGSFKTYKEMYAKIPTFTVHNFTFENYLKLSDQDFFLYYLNSVKVTAFAVTLGVIVAYFAAYSLCKLRYPGRKFLGKMILIVYLIPGSLLIIPLYMILTGLGLINTHTGLIIAYLSLSVPYATWLLMGYFKSIPDELIESAIIDGCTHLKIMGSIFFPLVKPGIITTVIFSFVGAWNNLLYPMVLITRQNQYLAPVQLARMIVGDSTLNWQTMMAGATLLVIPPVIFFIFLQRFITGGLTSGSVKG